MKNQQTSKKNMYNKCLQFFSKNSIVWMGFQRLVDEITRFSEKNQELDTFVQKQQAETGGITNDKNTKFVRLVNVTVKYARKARVWAADTHNDELEAVFDVHKSDFFGIPEDLASEKLENVRNAINDNLVDLVAVNITAVSIAEIDAANLAYESKEGAPGEAKAEKKTSTTGIRYIMAEVDESLEKIDDLLISEYEDDEPEMVENYRNVRRIDNIGVRHQGIGADVEYADGSGAAEGVTMNIVELNKTGVSDINGHVSTLRGRIGTYHVSFSGNGIETKTVVASIKRGTILNLEVEVEKSTAGDDNNTGGAGQS